MKALRLSRQTRRPSRPKPVENVLREGLRLERVPDPSMLVLFGATGDLAHRKVIPALYQLWRTNLLPHEFLLVAVGRRPHDDASFREEVHASLAQYSRVLPLDTDAWDSFSERIVYQRLDFDDPAGFDALAPTSIPSIESTAAAAIACSTWQRSHPSSRRSSPSSDGSAWTTRPTTAGGGGSSSRSRSATTSNRRNG